MSVNNLGDRSSIEEFLKEAPASAAEFLRKALPKVSSLNPAQVESLATLVTEALEDPRGALKLKVHQKLGVEREADAISLVTGGTLLASALQTTSPPEEVAAALASHYSLSEADAAAARTLINALSSKRVELARRMKRRFLSDAVLPSFVEMETMVDVRVGYEDGEQPLVVPVTVAFLKTDATNQRLWFQISKAKMVNLIEQLKEALEEMDKAESLVGRAPNK